MKLFLLLAGLACVSAYEEINLDYHSTVGIPLYEKSSQAELAQDFDGGRIVGGSQSSLGAHPHLGGLIITLTNGQRSLCGSSLISNTRLVTAAHCWRTRDAQGRSILVVLGSININSGGHRVNTNNIALHPNYNQNNLHNDVAVIVIPWVGYNNNIRNIGLASGSNNFAGQNAVAAGFGRIGDGANGNNNGRLRHVSLRVISNSECARSYSGGLIVSSTLCVATASNRNICQGDSGGSLVVNRQLIGITSFTSARGCQSGIPSGFARVTSFNSWIRGRM